jgi:hypothetical protein
VDCRLFVGIVFLPRMMVGSLVVVVVVVVGWLMVDG